MNPLKIILISTALSIASTAHSQVGSEGLVGGLLPSVTGIASQSLLPVVSGLSAENELIGSVASMASDLLNTTLNTALPLPVQGLDVLITAVDGLTDNGATLQLGGLTPVILNLTETASIPLIGGAVEGGIF
ncbi:hypothetical protein [Zhongshania sp. BJYM1]|uniref:hypothetical protein n=1 Tax=Zhongshania aquatica TaxID=2965069 RepID=UPI0022B2D353|nr:hypothetical protein [Marortus sp. BJYM1]